MTLSQEKDLEVLIKKLSSEDNLHQMNLNDESLYTGVINVLNEIQKYIDKTKHISVNEC